MNRKWQRVETVRENGGVSARKLVLDQTVTVPKQSGINYT
jgi:hypothetical protein